MEYVFVNCTSLWFAEDENQALKCAELCLNLQNFDNDEKSKREYLDLAHTTTGRTALIMAARFSNSQFMKLLIQNGANALKEDKLGSTVLYYAVDNGKKSLLLRIYL